MKKIFILTGEPSGDKLASEVIKQIKLKENNIQYLCLGGENLKSLNIESISNLKDITYIGITSVFLNIFKIKKIINETVKKIVEFKKNPYKKRFLCCIFVTFLIFLQNEVYLLAFICTNPSLT